MHGRQTGGSVRTGTKCGRKDWERDGSRKPCLSERIIKWMNSWENVCLYKKHLPQCEIYCAVYILRPDISSAR
ncbi:hypothetical protein DXA13_19380 [Clostridium sp. AM58-1XD]|nr:hypothetical protein DXA13_19380 [Clostridium sp. AM58-1XD]